jgi:hypothetical protein
LKKSTSHYRKAQIPDKYPGDSSILFTDRGGIFSGTTDRLSTHSSRLILILSMLLSGILSIYFGKELCWDLANYHFYNPFALLHARSTVDYWPNSNVHQYINPTIDLLSYFLIQNFTPRMSEFILGAIHGINLWLLFLIANRFLQGPYRTPLALLIALLGLYGLSPA